jgi:hypothetical protein
MATTIHEHDRLERSRRRDADPNRVQLDIGEYLTRLTMAHQVELVCFLRRELAREAKVLERMVAETHG